MFKRKSWEAQSVVMWMYHGETYAQAKLRLDLMWEQGTHPAHPNQKKPQFVSY